MSQMTPREIVHELNRHIIGQDQAKRAVAIALRNRWRRMQIEEPLRSEISPKNILMIGPTGVGKTEIARRLAKLANAPFIKVEATKFTEVGYVGKDVEAIIRDLVEVAIKMKREQEMDRVRFRAQEAAEERVLDILLPKSRDNEESENNSSSTRQVFRKKLREGDLNDREIELDVAAQGANMEIMTPPGMEEMAGQLQEMFSNFGRQKKHRRKLNVKEALRLIEDEEAAKLVDPEELKTGALKSVEQNGIVFIDEIDKVARRGDVGGADVSREGVQRDLLPLIEGSNVSTKYGIVKTDHILFIASGAFHLSKPSDLIPELQGRLPIRVELSALSAEDFQRILCEPDASLISQYNDLLGTEDIELNFTKEGITRIAEIAWQVNEQTENIGARRLHTLMERLLEEISFTSGDVTNDKLTIDDKYVDGQLATLAADEDLSRFIL